MKKNPVTPSGIEPATFLACSAVPQPTVHRVPLENRVLRRIFGLKRDEVTGEWRKLHNEEINDLYCSPSIVWMIK